MGKDVKKPGTSEEPDETGTLDQEYEKALEEEFSKEEDPAKGKPAPEITDDKKKEGEVTPPSDEFKVPDELRAGLETLGLKDVEVTKDNLPFIEPLVKRAQEEATRASNAEQTARRYGSQNKDLSERYQKTVKELEDVKAAITPRDKIRKVIEAIDKDTLAPDVREYLEDDAFLDTLGLVLGPMVTEKPPAEAPPEGGGGKEGEDQKPLTPEQQEELNRKAEEYGKAFESKVLEVHSDGNEVIATAEFQSWLKGQSPYDLLKFTAPQSPQDLIKLIGDYKQYRGALDADAQRKKEEAERLAAGASHDENAGGGGPGGGEEGIDYLAISDEEFDKLDAKVRARQGGT